MIFLLSKYGAIAFLSFFKQLFSWALGVCLGCTHIACSMLNTNNFHLFLPLKRADPSQTGVICKVKLFYRPIKAHEVYFMLLFV